MASRRFEDSELKLLIDGVLQSKHITAKHSKDLIERLSSLSNRYFRSHIKNVYSVNEWSKTENQSLFYNIDIVDQIVDWFGTDVSMQVLAEDEKKVSVSLVASPMAMEYWAIQYARYVVVTKPEHLREKIRQSLLEALKGY